MNAVGGTYGYAYTFSRNVQVLGESVERPLRGTFLAPFASPFVEATKVPIGAVNSIRPDVELFTGRDFRQEYSGQAAPGERDFFKNKPTNFIGQFAGTVQTLASSDFSKVDLSNLGNVEPTAPARQLTYREQAGAIAGRKPRKGKKPERSSE